MAASLTAIPPTHITSLIAGARSGTPGAENHLWTLMRPHCLQLATWLLASDGQRFRITADDLVQLAFLRVRPGYVRRPGLRRDDLRGMVRLAMTRVLVDMSRRSKAESRVLGEWRGRDRVNGLAQCDIADLRDRMERLMRCNPLQSRILELHIFQGLSHQRIAEVLKISASQVRNEIVIATGRLSAMG